MSVSCINLDKFIPKGFYCYKILNVEVTDNKKPFNGGVIIHTKQCMFYQHKKESCWLMDGKEIDDQCKICGLNEFTNGEIEKTGKDIEKESNTK